jgi:hypothetical protein
MNKLDVAAGARLAANIYFRAENVTLIRVNLGSLHAGLRPSGRQKAGVRPQGTSTNVERRLWPSWLRHILESDAHRLRLTRGPIVRSAAFTGRVLPECSNLSNPPSRLVVNWGPLPSVRIRMPSSASLTATTEPSQPSNPLLLRTLTVDRLPVGLLVRCGVRERQQFTASRTYRKAVATAALPLTGHPTKSLVWRQKADSVEEVGEVLGSE